MEIHGLKADSLAVKNGKGILNRIALEFAHEAHDPAGTRVGGRRA